LLQRTITNLAKIYLYPNKDFHNQFLETHMTVNTEKFVAANKAAVDSLLSVANTALASAERIAALNLNTARAALEDTVSGVQAIAGAKSPQDIASAATALTQPAIEKATAYARSIYEITSQSQGELTKMIEAQFGDFQKTVAGLVEQATKSAPAGSETALAAVQSAMAAATSAFGNMNAVAKQFAEQAQTNVAAATKAVTAAAKKSK
jgi:phasin family protein